jgi:hypothetical protein
VTPDPAPSPDAPGGGAGLPTNRKAVISVVLGAVAFALVFLSGFAAFILAVPSVTTGIHARREIKAGHAGEGGDLLAVVGLTTGATTLGLLLVSWLLAPNLPV